jgi:hypothetical protein
VTSVNLSGSFNQTGIYADGATFSGTGGLDGHGNALSTNLLGTGQNWNGHAYIIGPAGAADVVSAVGQTIALTQGQFSTLSFLATATNGSYASQSFTVTYTDGTTQTFSQSISDWYNSQGYAGETVAIRMAYRDLYNGTKSSPSSGPFKIYGYSFALNPSKTVKSITLPNQPNVKLLAIDLVSWGGVRDGLLEPRPGRDCPAPRRAPPDRVSRVEKRAKNGPGRRSRCRGRT